MSAYLLIDGPGVWAYQFALAKGKTIEVGRNSKCEIKLNDSSVSGRHATLFQANGEWMIRDNQSSNGTLVNDGAIEEWTLRHGDTIRIGKTELVYHEPDSETADDFLDRTQALYSQEEQAIRGAIRQAGPNQMVRLPDPVAYTPTPMPGPPPRHPASPPARANVPRRPFSPPPPPPIGDPFGQPPAPPPPPPVRASPVEPSRPAPAPSRPAPPPLAPPSGVPAPRSVADMPGLPDLPGLEPEQAMDDFEFNPDRYAGAMESAGSRDKSAREDALWIAEKTADVLGAMAGVQGQGRHAVQTVALQAIKGVIGAENGFLMVADRKDKRWVIRAWVGDPTEWTSFEKQHPVPLTAANQAFKEDRIVSNALGADDTSKSESMLILNVHCYIAVPLRRSGVKEGLLYFDTRRSLKAFADRDVKLIERVGGYILQMESPSHPG